MTEISHDDDDRPIVTAAATPPSGDKTTTVHEVDEHLIVTSRRRWHDGATNPINLLLQSKVGAREGRASSSTAKDARMEWRSRRTATGARLQVRVAETIANELRERILSDSLPNAMLPPQEQLVAEFGVSAPSIREALRILEVEGLITVRRGKHGGAVIHPPSAASAAYAIALSLHGQGVTLRDVAQSLLLLEPACAASCAQLHDRRDTVVRLLRENVEWCVDAPDGVEFTHRAREFHDLTVAHSPLGTIRLLVGSLIAVWSIQEETWASTLTNSGRYPARSSNKMP